MIHSDTEIRYINAELGHGVFARSPIPKGTLVVVNDPFMPDVVPADFESLSAPFKNLVYKYSYVDKRGHHIIDWDHAKYINHHCSSNTLTSGYGFQIAVRDIAQDEQIFADDGLFNEPFDWECHCGCTSCRRTITMNDFEKCSGDWDMRIRHVITGIFEVRQPLMFLINDALRSELESLIQAPERCRSVTALKFPARNLDR